MPVGYNSHGVKASLREIGELEALERGNPWFNDEWFDPDESKAIWICQSRRKAAEYVMPAGEVDAREPTTKEQDEVTEVDLTDSIVLLTDGDEGYLHVWPIRLRSI